jgi:hypothetical protein
MDGWIRDEQCGQMRRHFALWVKRFDMGRNFFYLKAPTELGTFFPQQIAKKITLIQCTYVGGGPKTTIFCQKINFQYSSSKNSYLVVRHFGRLLISIGRFLDLIGRLLNFIGRFLNCIGLFLNFIGRLLNFSGRLLNFIGRLLDLIGRLL